jgi:hypothetical protein
LILTQRMDSDDCNIDSEANWTKNKEENDNIDEAYRTPLNYQP